MGASCLRATSLTLEGPRFNELTLERVAQRSVIVFERGGERIAHRVFAVEADGYVTRGDANAAPDTDRVRPDDVIGGLEQAPDQTPAGQQEDHTNDG